MIVGDDVAVRRDEEAGPLRHRQVMLTARHEAFAVIVIRHAELLEEMLEFVAEEVAELGNQREIEHIERIMREGTGADRQLTVWERTQDMKAVVDQIVAETNEDLLLR